MKNYVHSLGKFGTGKLEVKSGRLNLVCNDTDNISRVFSSDYKAESPLGFGWSISLGHSGKAKLCYSNGKLSRFVDGGGKSYGFYYDSGRIESIFTDDGMYLYDYNADGMLTTVRYPDKSRLYLSYGDFYRLQDICAKDADGNGIFAVSYIYGLDDKVEYIYQYAYDGKKRIETCFADFSDRSNVLTFTRQDATIKV